MSRLIEIDPQSKQEPEPKGYEFGYYVFDNLTNIEVNDMEMTINSTTDVETKDTSGNNFQGFPMQEGQLYIVRDNILKRYMTEGDNIYETTVYPDPLLDRSLN